jgi:hypothetical protein
LLVNATDGGDDRLRKMLIELARTEERGPIHRVVLNGCRVLRYVADGSVVSREEAGTWALEHWRASDHELVKAALARETGVDRKATIDFSVAIFFGFRAEAIAKGGGDPQDQ